MPSHFTPHQQQHRLTQQARSRFVQLLDDVPQELAKVIRQQYATLMEGRFPDMRSAQQMSDAQLAFDRSGRRWSEHAQRLWRDALQGRNAELATPSDLGELEIIDDEVVERKIVMLRLASAVTEAAGAELRDARLRVLSLDRSSDLPKHDVLRPETMANLLLKAWTAEGMTREMWTPVSAAVSKVLSERMAVAYRSLNEYLVANGAMEKIDMRQQVRRTEGGSTQPGRLSQPGQFGANSHPGDDLSSAYSRTAYMPPPGSNSHGANPHGLTGYGAPLPYPQQFQSYEAASARALQAMRALRAAQQASAPPPPPPAEPPVLEDEWDPNDSMLEYTADYDSGRMDMVHQSALMRAAMETRMMTRAAPAMAQAAAAAMSPLSRMRQKAQGMLAQLQRLVAHRVKGFGEAPPDGVVPAPLPALAAALANPQYFQPTMLAPRPSPQHGAYIAEQEGSYSGMETIIIPSMHALAGDLRRKADDIKSKAERPDEKATIEIVALMFQAILAEEHIPAGIRVWFARLQIPVLRLALAEPDFFASSDHPARQLIDRMGACAMGFDAAQVEGSALAREVKRIVQTIEQYPETGRRVYQMMLDEFKRFLGKSLTETQHVQQAATLAQQVEQKETLAVQYTIELRRMLEAVPVAEDVREFMFHIWSDVLALAAVRYGAQGDQTLYYKQTAADLLWAASPRSDREERSRVVRRMSGLLAALRKGMTMLGIQATEQDGYIKLINDAVTQAFSSRATGMTKEKLEELKFGLAALEDVITDEGDEDMALDPGVIEMMFGGDDDEEGSVEVITQGGSTPGQGMLAWARELEIGTWFTLDWNGAQLRVQYVWRSARGQLHLLAAGSGRSFLVQTKRLAAYLQAGLLAPLEEEALTVRATRRAIRQLDAAPQALLQ
ncbi:MAG: DUF1631 family protein [Ottowia sp.]|nr:DUF1631 family protein [Ottowia sp.]